jgi:hypothetical protein
MATVYLILDQNFFRRNRTAQPANDVFSVSHVAGTAQGARADRLALRQMREAAACIILSDEDPNAS